MDTLDQQVVTKSEKNLKKTKSPPNRVRRFLFSVLWISFLIRILIADIGLLVNQSYLGFENGKFILIRFLLISLIILFVWIKLGNKKFWKNTGLLLLYPIYPVSTTVVKSLAWSIPKFLFERKYTGLLFNYFDTILKFFFHLKMNLVKSIFGVLAFMFLFTLEGNWLIIPIGLLTFLIVNHLYRRYSQTFEPIKLFQVNVERFTKIEGEIFNKQKFEETISKDPISKKAKDREKNDEIGVTVEEATISLEDDSVVGSRLLGDNDDPKSEKTIEIDSEGKIIDKRLEKALVINEFVRAFKYKMEDVLNSRSYMKSFI